MPALLAFLHRGPISPRLHGTLDHPLAATVHGIADLGATTGLIAAPFALGFRPDRRATAFCVVVGAAGLGATLLTRFDSDL